MNATDQNQEHDVLRVFQSKSETKAYYNKIAKYYDLLAEHDEQPMREHGLRMLAAQPGERILEIGCGTGHSLVEIAQSVGPDGNASGIDISEAMLERTRNEIQQHDLTERTELVCGDAESLPFSDKSFDGIFTSFTLELFDTPAIPQVLSECRRVLRPGGRLVVVSISKAGKAGLVMKAYEWTHKHFPNLMDCRPIYAEWALADADFRIAETRSEEMWVPVEIVKGIKQE
jgi:ubiquinone/menaquinone biosynthesis C-methylase UbiE